jgi:PAS domain S-box-containing protein
MPRPGPGFSERRLTEIGRAAADSQFVGVAVWDATGQIVEANEALAELLDRAPAELLGQAWADLTPPRYRALDDRAAEALRQQGRFPPYEKHLLRRDGGEVPVLVGGAALAGGGVAFVLDLTEQQVAQDALQLSEEQFRALARNVPGVVYLCESDRWQPFRFVSQAVEQLTGVASRRFCDGRAAFRDLLHPDDALRVAQDVQAALGKRRPFHVVYRLRHTSGEWRTVEEHGQGIRSDGELRFIEGVILDVTARQQAEDAVRAAHDQLRAAHDDLEARVGQRTAKLRKANQRLRREQEFLRRTLDQQERHRQLVAYEIHDGLAQYITGALMQIEAFAGMRNAEGEHAAEARSPAASRSRASSVRIPQAAFRNLEVGLELLRKSLDEARRLISGLRPPILDEKGLVAAIDYLISEQPPLSQGIHFSHDVQFDRLPPLWESNLFRIVQEALTNVTRHGRARTARIDLWQKGQTLHLTVVDDGQGYDRKRALEGALPAARKHGQQGIRKRARLLGGKATIRSAEGRGTRISVVLPLPDGEDDEVTR